MPLPPPLPSVSWTGELATHKKTEWCKWEKYANFNLCMSVFLQKHLRDNLVLCFKTSALLLLFGPKPAEKGPKRTLSLCNICLPGENAFKKFETSVFGWKRHVRNSASGQRFVSNYKFIKGVLGKEFRTVNDSSWPLSKVSPFMACPWPLWRSRWYLRSSHVTNKKSADKRQ